MATDYALNLKATLDTSEVQQKLQQLGTAGTQSFDSLEKAVKDLDNSLKQVVQTMQKAQTTAPGVNASAAQILRLGSRYVGGQLLGAAGDYFARSGNRGGALLAGMGSSALQGAAAGMALGPGGAGIGAVIGAAVPIFKQLAEEANSTSNALVELSDASKVLKAAMDAEASTAGARQRLRQIPGLDDAALAARRAENEAKIKRYEDYATGEVDFGDATEEQRKATLEGLKEAADRAEAEIRLIDQTMKERQRVADAAAKQAEAAKKLAEAEEERAKKLKEQNQERAGSTLSDFTRAMKLEQFASGLSNMSPQQLQDLVQSLTLSRTEMGGSYSAALEKAQSSGLAADLEAAKDAGDEFDDLTNRLKAAQHALDLMTKPSSNGSLASLSQLMGGPMSTEAAKGYDVGGYSSLEDALFRQQLQAQQRIDTNTQKAASTLDSMKNAVDEIRNKVQNSASSGTWG